MNLGSGEGKTFPNKPTLEDEIFYFICRTHRLFPNSASAPFKVRSADVVTLRKVLSNSSNVEGHSNCALVFADFKCASLVHVYFSPIFLFFTQISKNI